MHRPQQKPHTRGNNPLNTSPPSMKRPPLHRHTSSPSPSPSSANKPPTPKKGSSAIKPQRPPVHHRRTASAHYITHHPRNKSQQSLGKLLGAGSGPASYSVKPEVEHLEMATSFLQYCAMCEKQITVPSNSVLYCSESCRRKDSYKPLSASSYTYTMTSSPSSPINIDQPTTSSIIMPTSSPTSRPIPVSRPLARIPSDLHDSKSDLDPTEWKPIISGRHGRNGSSTSLASSDAWTYLSQFHHHHHRGGDETGRISSSTPPSSSLQAMMMPFRRTPTTRNSTSSLSTMGGGSTTTTPSLVNTPRTTTASSSVTGSPPSSSSVSDYIGAAVPSYGGYTYAPPDLAGAAAMMDPSRPLPPRHNPSFSTSGAGATKGVELVVPHIIASAEDEDVHEGIWMRA